jgi:hypothetical protein
LQLIRELDEHNNTEWLLVQYEEVTGKKDFTLIKLEWNDDLMIWMDMHQEAIDNGDISVFYEYFRRNKMNLR